MSSKTKRPRQQQQKKRKEKEDESGEWTKDDIIRCICGDDEEDGLMIQCNHCSCWLHCGCVSISRNNIPDRYKCDYCKKSKRNSISTTEQEEFKVLSKNKVDKLTVMGKYRNIRKLWQQYQSSKESLKPSEQECFASCPTMESSEYLCPSIPKASMKPLSRHMRATSISSQRDPSIQKGIFADEHIQENRYLMEVTGKVIEKADYKKNESNMYLTLFTTLPHVFFHPTLDLCVDARYYGNDARFVRRSCHPNAELKTIMIPSQDTLDFVHLGIYTTKQVRRGEEITIPWYWARLNRIKSDFNKNRQVDLDDDLKHEISEMLAILNAEYGECACDDKDTCFVEFLGDEMDETSPSFVEKEQDLAMLSKAGTDSTDEETPIENYHRPSIPPSPAESVHDAGVSNRDALVAMEDKKLPMKKRWLQRFLREKSLQS